MLYFTLSHCCFVIEQVIFLILYLIQPAANWDTCLSKPALINRMDL